MNATQVSSVALVLGSFLQVDVHSHDNNNVKIIEKHLSY